MSRLDPPPVTRRSFLSMAAISSFFAAIGTAVAGILRLPNPAVLPGPVRRFKLGPPEQFLAGSETPFPDDNLTPSLPRVPTWVAPWPVQRKASRAHVTVLASTIWAM